MGKIVLVFLVLLLSLPLLGELKSIKGDEAIWKEKEGVIYFKGNVEIVDTGLILRSDEAKIKMEGNTSSRISGEKGVEIIKGKEKVQADTFLLLPEERMIYLGGKVKILRDKMILQGESGIFDLEKGKVLLKGNIQASFP
ncbi:MAG: hypothetical protein GXO71_03150 [Caldiserica bacterium]|nr:hypothetical protein [Caldisericota bacterium]